MATKAVTCDPSRDIHIFNRQIIWPCLGLTVMLNLSHFEVALRNAGSSHRAAVVLGTAGRYLFQRRDDIPDIVYPGTLSLFGGHREPGETYLAASLANC